MTQTHGGYARMPGRRILSFGVVNRLFAGPDHLLLLASTCFSETYKRFYYRDIQAVVTRRTRRGAAWNAVLGVFAGICLLVAATRGPGGEFAAACWWSCSLPFLLLMLVNALRGPTCAVHLRTAVHLVELPTLGRLRAARKAVALLKPRIAEAQGVLAPEGLPLAGAPGPHDAVPRATPPLPSAAPSARDAGRAHEFLFYALLVDGILSIVAFQVRSLWATLIQLPVFIGLTGILIAAMIRQRQREVPPGLRKALWATVAYWSVSIVVGYFVAVAVAVKNPAIGNNQWELTKYVAALRPADSPVTLYAHLFGIVCPLVLGLSGLVVLLRNGHSGGRRGPRPAPASP